jgi:hypothetical protein
MEYVKAPPMRASTVIMRRRGPSSHGNPHARRCSRVAFLLRAASCPYHHSKVGAPTRRDNGGAGQDRAENWLLQYNHRKEFFRSRHLWPRRPRRLASAGYRSESRHSSNRLERRERESDADAASSIACPGIVRIVARRLLAVHAPRPQSHTAGQAVAGHAPYAHATIPEAFRRHIVDYHRTERVLEWRAACGQRVSNGQGTHAPTRRHSRRCQAAPLVPFRPARQRLATGRKGSCSPDLSRVRRVALRAC